MIVFEEVLEQIFEQLPNITDVNGNEFKPRFNWGTQDVLNKFIALPENISKYPLIWLVSSGVENHSVANNRANKNVRLILAKNSDTPNEFNDFIFKTDYKLILNPLLENVIKALERNGKTKILDYDYSVEKLTNYSEGNNEAKTVAIWNVIVFDVDLEIDGKKCIKTIKF